MRTSAVRARGPVSGLSPDRRSETYPFDFRDLFVEGLHRMAEIQKKALEFASHEHSRLIEAYKGAARSVPTVLCRIELAQSALNDYVEAQKEIIDGIVEQTAAMVGASRQRFEVTVDFRDAVQQAVERLAVLEKEVLDAAREQCKAAGRSRPFLCASDEISEDAMTSRDVEQAIKGDSVSHGQNDSTIPREQAVREKAYSLYEQRGRGDGGALDDWLNAESALRGSETSTPNAARTREEKSKALSVEFIKADLDTAVTFSGAALEAQSTQDTAHQRVNARAAYRGALRKASNTELKVSDTGEIVDKVDKLKSNFDKLGEPL